MGVYEIHVGVALQRPPRTDEVRKYLIDDERGPRWAELTACQWAASDPAVVMPVFSRLVVFEPDTMPPPRGR